MSGRSLDHTINGEAHRLTLIEGGRSPAVGQPHQLRIEALRLQFYVKLLLTVLEWLSWSLLCGGSVAGQTLVNGIKQVLFRKRLRQDMPRAHLFRYLEIIDVPIPG